MVLLKTLWFAFFTLAVVRVLAARATLSERTLGTYLLFGALYGLIATPLLDRVVSPYGEMGPWIAFFGALVLHAALLAPVAWHLFRTRVVAGLSVADVFLVAYLIGFGAMLGSALLGAATAEQPIQGLTNFPPWQWRPNTDAEGPTVPGVAYWTAFSALLMVGAHRFLRQPWAVWAAAGVGLLFTSFESGALAVPPQGIWETLFKLTRQGGLTAWAVVGGLVALQVLEGRWERAAGGAPEDGPSTDLLEEGKTLAGSLLARRWAEFERQASAFRLARQARISLASAPKAENPPRAERGARVMAEAAARGPVAEARYGSSGSAPGFAAVWGGWIALAVALFALPRLPEGLRNWLWSFWGLHFVLPGLPFTLLMGALVLVLLRRLLAVAGRPSSVGRPGAIVSFMAERGVAMAAYGYVLAALVYVQPQRLLDPAPYLAGVEAGAQPWHASTLLLLVAVAATGVLASRTCQWRAAPIEDRRRAALRTGLEMGTLFGLVWAVNAFYSVELAKFHDRLGPALYRRFEGDGNYVAALATAAITGLACAALLAVARRMIRGTEEFMVGSGG